MPTFAPSQSVTARATLPVKPAGLACQAELYLGTGKAATSGKIPFTSTGADQQIILPITMPASGTYQVLLDVTTEGQLIGAFYATEQVVISVPSFQFSTPTATLESAWPGSTFQAANFSCRVSNPYGSSMTRTLRAMWAPVAEPSNAAPRVLDNGLEYRVVTLAPGQSYTLYSPAIFIDRYGEEAPNSPLFSLRACFLMWCQDDLGNKSPVITVCRS